MNAKSLFKLLILSTLLPSKASVVAFTSYRVEFRLGSSYHLHVYSRPVLPVVAPTHDAYPSATNLPLHLGMGKGQREQSCAKFVAAAKLLAHGRGHLSCLWCAHFQSRAFRLAQQQDKKAQRRPCVQIALCSTPLPVRRLHFWRASVASKFPSRRAVLKQRASKAYKRSGCFS